MIRPMPRAPERTAVLVIRAWLEEDNVENPLRVRITRTLDVSAAKATETFGAASEDEVLAAVRSWLRAFVSGT